MENDEALVPEQVTTSNREWSSCVITLDDKSPRYREFARANRHLPFQAFIGIRGAGIPAGERIRSGLATPELVASGRLTDGAAGAAASHRRLWEQAAASKGGMLIMEDDVVTHEGLAEYINRNHQLLAQTAITHFGVNTDSVLQAVNPQGLVLTALQDPKHPSPPWIREALSRTDAARCELWRLLKSFGLCCYFVSPHGAATLLRTIFPLSLETVSVPFVSDALPCSAVDRIINRVYPEVPAFVTVPFLAYTPNTDSSTKPDPPA